MEERKKEEMKKAKKRKKKEKKKKKRRKRQEQKKEEKTKGRWICCSRGFRTTQLRTGAKETPGETGNEAHGVEPAAATAYDA